MKTQNKSKPQGQVPKQQPKTVNSKPHPVIHLPEVTDKYIHSLCEPDVYRNVGLPATAGSIVTSLKQHAFAKGSMTIGTAGYGFVVLSPGLMAVNDKNSVLFSDAAYGGNSIGVVGPGVFGAASNSMFVTADIGPGDLAAWRVVSAGLKIRYNGSQLNLGGTAHSLQHPQHEDLFAYTTPDLDAYVQSKRSVVDRVWTSVLYCPTQAGYVTNLTAQQYVGAFMGILVQSIPGNTFDWEACLNFEVSGSHVRGQTYAVNDPVGFGAAAAAMATEGGTYHGNSGKPVHKSVMEKIKDYLVAGMTWIGDKGIPFLETVVEKTPLVLEVAAAFI